VEVRQWYLLAEEAVHQKDEDALQAVDDGEEVSHDMGSWTHLQDAQAPCAAQDEQLSCGFKCQHPCVLEGGHIFVDGGELGFHNPEGHQKESQINLQKTHRYINYTPHLANLRPSSSSS